MFVSDDLKRDKEIRLAAVLQDCGTLLLIDSPKFAFNEEQNDYVLQFSESPREEDRELVLAAAQKNGWALQLASDDLKKDKEIVLAAVKQNGLALQFAHKSAVLAIWNPHQKWLKRGFEERHPQYLYQQWLLRGFEQQNSEYLQHQWLQRGFNEGILPPVPMVSPF